MAKAFYKDLLVDSPIIIDAINEVMYEFFHKYLLYNTEIDKRCEGQGKYRVLKNTSDALAFRNRVEQTEKSFPILPFTNFRWKDIKPDEDDFRWTNIAYNLGLYDSDIEARIRCVPTIIEFEATTWVNRNDDMISVRKLIEKLRNKKKIKQTLENHFAINGTPSPMPIFITFEESSIDKYNDVDWLKENKINAITHAFTVRYFDLYVDRDGVYPVDKIIFQLLKDAGEDDPSDMEITDEVEIV